MLNRPAELATLGPAYEGNNFGNQLGTDDGWLPARNASIARRCPIKSRSPLDSWLNGRSTSPELGELAQDDEQRDHSSAQLSDGLAGQNPTEA
ncbi:hypothetical protein ACVI1I_006328 [Bradyrhizobium sp. USDA 4459]